MQKQICKYKNCNYDIFCYTIRNITFYSLCPFSDVLEDIWSHCVYAAAYSVCVPMSNATAAHKVFPDLIVDIDSSLCDLSEFPSSWLLMFYCITNKHLIGPFCWHCADMAKWRVEFLCVCVFIYYIVYVFMFMCYVFWLCTLKCTFSTLWSAYVCMSVCMNTDRLVGWGERVIADGLMSSLEDKGVCCPLQSITNIMQI